MKSNPGQREITPSTESPDLVAVWRELMSSHARVSEALEHDLQRRHDLSLSEFEVIQRLAESDTGKRRMQELADEIHLSQSAVSRLVGRLEDKGLAKRAVCDHDRRGVWAGITPAGRAAQRNAEITHRKVLAGMLGGRSTRVDHHTNVAGVGADRLPAWSTARTAEVNRPR